MAGKIHKLSDGTTITVRTVRGIIGTEFQEVPSRKRKANTMIRIDSRMYCLIGPRKDMIPVRHPEYSYAGSDAEGARKALAFFVECAEGCIAEAAKEGIPVEQCYGA